MYTDIKYGQLLLEQGATFKDLKLNFPRSSSQ